MPELRRDIVRDSWVVIATERTVKPMDLPVPSTNAHSKNAGTFCPFCEGNEETTPSELAAFRSSDSTSNGPGWQVRAIPNKYSAFNPRSEISENHNGIYTCRGGYGNHEVIIETPNHDEQFHQHSIETISLIYRMLRQRYSSLKSNPNIKHIQIYKNSGLFAGASLAHSHTQIIAVPYLPAESEGARHYGTETGRCVFCDMIDQEKSEKTRQVLESDSFIVICPYASRFTFETWIMPKSHQEDFDSITDNQILELAAILKKVTGAVVALLQNPSYNIVVNSAPVNTPQEPGYHWRIEIWPRLIVQAGVEIATGTFMNPVSPEWAAETIRGWIRE
ncbi:MAG: galactose-1-phosphate uridylyltransferase [Acidobacteriota bacterium]